MFNDWKKLSFNFEINFIPLSKCTVHLHAKVKLFKVDICIEFSANLGQLGELLKRYIIPVLYYQNPSLVSWKISCKAQEGNVIEKTRYTVAEDISSNGSKLVLSSNNLFFYSQNCPEWRRNSFWMILGTHQLELQTVTHFSFSFSLWVKQYDMW